jgi:hypothetical protein
MQTFEDFVAANVHSVEELEILLLLQRSPETFWSADAIAQHLSLRPDGVAGRCRELERRGLLRGGESGPVFRFAPADSDAVAQVARLATMYRDQRITVLNAIYSAGLTRLRSFAEAFKLGGGKKE